MNQAMLRQLTPEFYVAPQLEPGQLSDLAANGIRTVINNRPDGEAADQMSHAEAEKEAREAGLAYAFVPVVSGAFGMNEVLAMRDAIERNRGPILAYCRTGTRSCNLWALAVAPHMSPDEIISAAASAGYDLEGLRSVLTRLHDATA